MVKNDFSTKIDLFFLVSKVLLTVCIQFCSEDLSWKMSSYTNNPHGKCIFAAIDESKKASANTERCWKKGKRCKAIAGAVCKAPFFVAGWAVAIAAEITVSALSVVTLDFCGSYDD